MGQPYRQDMDKSDPTFEAICTLLKVCCGLPQSVLETLFLLCRKWRCTMSTLAIRT